MTETKEKIHTIAIQIDGVCWDVAQTAGEIKKVVFVPGRLVNLITKEPKNGTYRITKRIDAPYRSKGSRGR